ncbi:hypothetical protein Taro_036540 [Colocasia esculenta]|uniref:rRNA methyltransferase 1, mitochondrial n=1 Tax=Colocasia esculenta TaxID=4460 RepID=A0A843WDN1_COLES|nr:hypothetical protein [Colocasia esculenta]
MHPPLTPTPRQSPNGAVPPGRPKCCHYIGRRRSDHLIISKLCCLPCPKLLLLLQGEEYLIPPPLSELRRRRPLHRRAPSRSPSELLRGHLGGEALQSMVAKALVGAEVLAKAVIFSNGFRPKPLGSAYWMRARDFSAGTTQQKSASGAGGRGAGKALPWIAAYDGGGGKAAQKQAAARTGSSSWEESADSYFSRTGGRSGAGGWENRTRKAERIVSSGSRSSRDELRVDKEVNQEEDAGPVDDPRWNRIKSKYDRFVGKQARDERPEVVRWSRQEEWGRKTWKQATESSVPKMVGEGVYGVGPVLAALTVRRREFYSLYVQEGLDLSGNNKKKKDKKGVEKILRVAEEIGLTVKEASKHDLNMVVDNRPHQGLVLDASPLEMVGIRELDPVLTREGQKPPLWVALDEVMDPQNLGAILRSAYYFGVEGVVLCAKNSAPLSGVVSKASAGSLEMIELRTCKNMMQFLAASLENGWRVLGGSVSSKAVPLSEVEARVPTVLVLGSEGTGLRPLVERSCSQLIRIPGGIPVDINVGGSDEEEGGEVGEKCLAQGFKSFLAVESLNLI